MKNMKRLTLAVCAVLLACLLCVCAVAEDVSAPAAPAESIAPEAVVAAAAETEAEEPAAPVEEEPSQETAEEPAEQPSEEPVVTEETEAPEEPAEVPFSKGYVLAKAGLVLYADAALTAEAGELEADAVVYADGRIGSTLTVFYTVDAELATAYVKADKVEELTEAEVASFTDWCKKNEIEVFFDVAAKTIPLMDVTFVAEAPVVVEEPVVEEPVVEEPVVEEPVVEEPVVEELPSEELIEDGAEIPAEEPTEDVEEVPAEEPVSDLVFDAEALTYTSVDGEVIAYIDAEGNLIDAATGCVLAKVDLELGIIYIPEQAAAEEAVQE